MYYKLLGKQRCYNKSQRKKDLGKAVEKENRKCIRALDVYKSTSLEHSQDQNQTVADSEGLEPGSQ